MPFSLRWSEQLADLLMLWVGGGEQVLSLEERKHDGEGSHVFGQLFKQ